MKIPSRHILVSSLFLKLPESLQQRTAKQADGNDLKITGSIELSICLNAAN